MQHHRSIGTTNLVALMAAHRQALPKPLPNGALRRDPSGLPLDPREIDRIAEQLWQAEAVSDRPTHASV
jgi:hypothetical protein